MQVHSFCVFTCSYYKALTVNRGQKFTGVCLSHAVCVYSCEKSPLHNLICFTAVLTVCRRRLSGIVCVYVCVWWFTKLHYSTSKRLRSHAALTTKAILYTRYWQKTLHASQNHMLSVQPAKSYAVSRRWPFLTLFLCSWLQSRVSNRPCRSQTLLLSSQTASGNKLCGVFWRFSTLRQFHAGSAGIVSHTLLFALVFLFWPRTGRDGLIDL